MIQTSCRVRESDFRTLWLAARARELCERYVLHRKLWEFAVITTVFDERIATTRNTRNTKCLGFGCGNEPLPAWFASRNANVIATDLPTTDVRWSGSGQNSASIRDLPRREICNETTFMSRVSFEPVDMCAIPSHLLQGRFDFVWSAGSLEHLGSHAAGMEFVCTSMAALRKGGVAVHTTELSATLDGPTLSASDLVAYRRRDIVELARQLRAQGDELLTIDFTRGDGQHDMHVDKPPYERSCCHLSLYTNGYVLTSVALIVIRGGA